MLWDVGEKVASKKLLYCSNTVNLSLTEQNRRIREFDGHGWLPPNNCVTKSDGKLSLLRELKPLGKWKASSSGSGIPNEKGVFIDGLGPGWVYLYRYRALDSYG